MEVVKFLCLAFIFPLVDCWQYFTKFSDLKLIGGKKMPRQFHSEYVFGDCKRRDNRFYAHVHLDHMDVLGKTIVRGWLNIYRIPICIRLVARSYEEDTFRNTGYQFQMCVPRIMWSHTQRRFMYYYYEWYIPRDMIGGMNWDIYFFGPPTREWWQKSVLTDD